MKTIFYMFICILLTVVTVSAYAEPFISLGLGVHDANQEIQLSNPLGIIEAGYNLNSFTVKYTHISGITEREEGFGLNMLSISYTFK